MELVVPKIVKGFNYEILPSDKMQNKCGETFPAEKRIVLSEEIYENAIKGDGFARYTVAHEIGHLFLNDVDSISLCRMESNEKLMPYEDPEWQADAFAAELLMYYPLVINMSEKEIVRKCKVTSRAAHVQKMKIKSSSLKKGGGSNE